MAKICFPSRLKLSSVGTSRTCRSPRPSCPSPLAPQAKIRPHSDARRVCDFPQAANLIVHGFTIFTQVGFSMALLWPRPSWPLSLLPKAKVRPFSEIKEMAWISWRSKDEVGMGSDFPRRLKKCLFLSKTQSYALRDDSNAYLACQKTCFGNWLIETLTVISTPEQGPLQKRSRYAAKNVTEAI